MYISGPKLFFCALGLAFVMEGMIYFLFPSYLKNFLEKIYEMSPSVIRSLGLTAMIFGLIIIYFSI